MCAQKLHVTTLALSPNGAEAENYPSLTPSIETTVTLKAVNEDLQEMSPHPPPLSRESTMSPTHTAASDNNSSTAAAASGVTSTGDVDSDVPPQPNMPENQVSCFWIVYQYLSNFYFIDESGITLFH